MKIIFFNSSSDLRDWFEEKHDKTSELWVGFYKKQSGRASITYPEALDEALCFGWIDGVRKKIDESSYVIRFSPRRPNSVWSAVNIKRAEELKKRGLMKPVGLEAFEKRDRSESSTYSYENRPHQFEAIYERKFRANKKAWDFFSTQPPGYRRTAIWWVVSAKKEETRLRRLLQLINDSEKGIKIGITQNTQK
jgi:uncharacterized protein YdeI (YjbR/CyaY-like superfamily)